MEILLLAVVVLAIWMQPVVDIFVHNNSQIFVRDELISQGKETAMSGSFFGTSSFFLSLSCLVHRMQPFNTLSFTRNNNHRSEIVSMCVWDWGSVGLWMMTMQGVDGYIQSQPKLVGTGASGSAYQGRSTAVSGDGLTACVGGLNDNNGIGAVWFYTRANTDTFTWSQQGPKIVPNDSTGSQVYFGTSCSLNYNGNNAVVGGTQDSGYIGATWIITRDGSGLWAQQGAKRVGTGYVTSTACGLGYCVCQGWTISLASTVTNVYVTGGFNDNFQTGATWVFSLSGGVWYQVGNKLVGSGGSGTQQGYSVAISVNAITIAAGGPNDSNGGSVWIFTLNGSTYVQEGGKITTNSAASIFGISLALSANDATVVVGAYKDDNGVGAMYAFTRSVPGIWYQQGGKNVGTNYLGTSIYQGWSIAISANGNIAAVGGGYDNNNIGATWIFTRNGSYIWTQYGPKLVGSGYTGTSIYQGYDNSISLSADGSILLVGGYNDNGQIGAVWAFHDSSFILPTALPCTRPTTTASISFSSCSSPIPNGTICTPSCTMNYTASNSLSILCNNGTLSTPLGICNPNCVTLFTPLPANANYGTCTTNYPSGSSCNIACGSTSYLSSGSLTATCSTAGIWTTPSATCTPNPCPRPSDSSSTLYSSSCSTSIPSGSSCTPVCQNGYTASGPLNITCSYGTFSSPAGVCNPNPCVRPPDTTNETFSNCQSSTPSGSVCSPACNIGYTATASISMTCTLGNFSFPAGYCAANPCTTFPNAAHTVYSLCSASTPSGSTCVPTCQSGYSPSPTSDISILCLAGTFQPASSTCQPSPCATPTVSYPNTTGGCIGPIPSGTQCSLGCATGFVANGSLLVTCSLGILSAPSGTCQSNTNNECSQPTTVYPLTPGNCPASSPNGTVCTLGCASGYNQSFTGDFSAVCNNQTFIISIAAICVQSPCNLPSSLPTGMVAGSCGIQTQGNSSCTLACQSGYSILGSLQITCTAGTFSPITGLCTPNPCNQPGVAPSSGMSASNCPGQTPSGGTCMLQCIGGFTPLPSPSSLLITCTTGTFANVSGGVCVGVSSVAPLTASPGTVVTITLNRLQGNPPSDMYVSNYTVSGMYASSSFGMPDLGGSVPITAPLQMYVSSPSLGITNAPLTGYQANIQFLPLPVLKSVCPDKILAQVNQTVVVQATGFVAGVPIKCILNGIYAFDAYLNTAQTVSCNLYWPNGTANQIIQLNVANDGAVGAFTTQAGLPITIQGACDSQKPGSIPQGSSCICPAGNFDNGAACELCANGFYQDVAGSTSCKTCGDNEDTNLITGSTSSTACVCRALYFPQPRTGACIQCVEGMLCPGNNVILIRSGYWRASSMTTKVLACPGGSVSSIGANNTNTSLCASGYTGPICTVCAEGYARLGTTCVQCPQSGLNAFALIILILGAFLFAYFLIQSASSFEDDGSKSSEEKAEKQRQGSIEVIVKVALNYTQVLYYIGRLTSNWSDLVHRFFAAVGILSALSPNNYTIHCAANWHFYDSLVVMYVSPLIIVSILTVVYIFRHFIRSLEFKQSKTDYQLAVMLLLYQIHPTIMLEVINSFPCEHVGGTHTSYLKADMSVDCKSAQYKAYAAVSAIYLVVYVFGMLVLTVLRLRHNFHAGKLANPSHNAFVKYAFFFVGYRGYTYYWEAVIMLRKMGVVAFSVLPSAMLQLVFANVIITIALMLNIKYIPFSSQLLNGIESASLCTLLATITLGFLFINSGTGSSTLWISILVILVNTAMAAFLVIVFVKKMRDVLRGITKQLPAWLRFGDEFDDVVYTKNPHAASRATGTASSHANVEMASY